VSLIAQIWKIASDPVAVSPQLPAYFSFSGMKIAIQFLLDGCQDLAVHNRYYPPRL
jgi:hypothetical protein